MSPAHEISIPNRPRLVGVARRIVEVALIAAVGVLAHRVSWDSWSIPVRSPRVVECGGGEVCLPLPGAPYPSEVDWALRAGRRSRGALGPEWDVVTDIGERTFLELVLVHGEIEASLPSTRQRYRSIYDEAARRTEDRALLARRRRAHQGRDVTSALAVFGAVAAGVALLVADLRRPRAPAVRVGPDGVDVRGTFVPWDRIDAVDWYEGTVEVRTVGGRLHRVGRLDLPEGAVPEVERAASYWASGGRQGSAPGGTGGWSPGGERSNASQ